MLSSFQRNQLPDPCMHCCLDDVLPDLFTFSLGFLSVSEIIVKNIAYNLNNRFYY